MQETPKDGDRQRLDAAGITVLVGTFFGAFIQGVPLFAAAGTMALPRAARLRRLRRPRPPPPSPPHLVACKLRAKQLAGAVEES